MTTGLKTLDHSLTTTQEWLKDIQQELSLADQQQAFEVTRAVLHTLRDRLSVEEAVQFASQLPMILQGLYFHEWTPQNKPLKMHKQQFLDAVSNKMMRKHPPKDAIFAVFKVLEKRMTPGEVDHLRSILPADIAELLPEE